MSSGSISQRRYRIVVALVLFCSALVYLAGLDTAPLADRDEPRFAQTSRQMLQSGDWIVPRFLDEVRTAKPVMIYWLQAGTMRVLGDSVFAARLPSMVAMLLTLGLLASVLPYMVGRMRAGWATFVLSSSVLVFWSAKSSTTDSVLLLWITIAQLCLYAAWRGRAGWWIILCWGIVTGLAVLTKGPVIFGVQGATLILLWIFSWKPINRPAPIVSMSISKLIESGFARLAFFTLMVCIIAGPWLYLVTEREPMFLFKSISHDVIARAAGSLENHWGPPGYYLLTIWATFFPWSLFLVAAIGRGVVRFRSPIHRFSICAIVGPWILFECVSTKLPHYLLPVFPFLALLVADAIVAAYRRRNRWLGDRAFMSAAYIWGAIVCGVAVGAIVLTAISGESWWIYLAAFLLAIVLIVMAGWTIRWLRRELPAGAAIVMGVGAWIICLIVFGLIAPLSKNLSLAKRIGTVTKSEQSIWMIDYKEPSVAFYQGGFVREQSEDDALQRIPEKAWPDQLIVSQRVWDRQPDRVKKDWEIVHTDRGVTLARPDEFVEVLVLKKK